MPPISPQQVDQVADWLFQLEDEQEIFDLIDQLAAKQPLILAYLMAMGEGDFDQDEREMLLFLGAGIWKMMDSESHPISPVDEERLDKAEEKNLKMIEYLSIESDEGFLDFAKQLQHNYGQPAILEFVIESVMDDPTIQEQNQGVMVIFLKIVIDCLQG